MKYFLNVLCKNIRFHCEFHNIVSIGSYIFDAGEWLHNDNLLLRELALFGIKKSIKTASEKKKQDDVAYLRVLLPNKFEGFEANKQPVQVILK